MKRLPALLVAGALAVLVGGLAACSTPHSHVDIGIARIGLNLAFSNKALESAPVPPKIIIELIPAPPSLTAQAQPDLTPFVAPVVPTKVPIPGVCASAPTGASVPATAPLLIHAPPTPGFYREVNSGSEKVTADGFTFQFPAPPVTVMHVVAGPSPTTFQEITTLTPGDVVTETYDDKATELDLVGRSESNNGMVVSDTYSPPVKVYDSGGTGTSWTGLGLDLAHGAVLFLNAGVHAMHVVDACGSLLDTQEVDRSTTRLDLATLQTSGTTPGTTDVYDVATSLGGLFAQTHVRSTTVETVNKAPVTVVSDVTTTLAGLTPWPTPAQALQG